MHQITLLILSSVHTGILNKKIVVDMYIRKLTDRQTDRIKEEDKRTKEGSRWCKNNEDTQTDRKTECIEANRMEIRYALDNVTRLPLPPHSHVILYTALL